MPPKGGGGSRGSSSLPSEKKRMTLERTHKQQEQQEQQEQHQQQQRHESKDKEVVKRTVTLRSKQRNKIYKLPLTHGLTADEYLQKIENKFGQVVEIAFITPKDVAKFAHVLARSPDMFAEMECIYVETRTAHEASAIGARAFIRMGLELNLPTVDQPAGLPIQELEDMMLNKGPKFIRTMYRRKARSRIDNPPASEMDVKNLFRPILERISFELVIATEREFKLEDYYEYSDGRLPFDPVKGTADFAIFGDGHNHTYGNIKAVIEVKPKIGSSGASTAQSESNFRQLLSILLSAQAHSCYYVLGALTDFVVWVFYWYAKVDGQFRLMSESFKHQTGFYFLFYALKTSSRPVPREYSRLKFLPEPEDDDNDDTERKNRIQICLNRLKPNPSLIPGAVPRKQFRVRDPEADEEMRQMEEEIRQEIRDDYEEQWDKYQLTHELENESVEVVERERRKFNEIMKFKALARFRKGMQTAVRDEYGNWVVPEEEHDDEEEEEEEEEVNMGKDHFTKDWIEGQGGRSDIA